MKEDNSRSNNNYNNNNNKREHLNLNNNNNMKQSKKKKNTRKRPQLLNRKIDSLTKQIEELDKEKQELQKQPICTLEHVWLRQEMMDEILDRCAIIRYKVATLDKVADHLVHLRTLVWENWPGVDVHYPETREELRGITRWAKCKI